MIRSRDVSKAKLCLGILSAISPTSVPQRENTFAKGNYQQEPCAAGWQDILVSNISKTKIVWEDL